MIREPLRKGDPPAKQRPLRAYGYMRVSTDEPSAEGFELRVQKEMIEAYCMRKGFEMAGYFIDDGVSGWIPLDQRPMGERLCTQFRPGDHVVMARHDRGFRNTTDTLVRTQSWLEEGVVTHFVNWGMDTSQPFWRVMAPMAAMMAEWDREQIITRTKEVLMDRRRRGQRWANRAPIGFRYVRDRARGWSRRGNPRMIVVLNEPWMAQVQLIVSWRDVNHMTFTDIARRFIYRKEKPQGGYARDWSEFLVRAWYVRYKGYQLVLAQRASMAAS